VCECSLQLSLQHDKQGCGDYASDYEDSEEGEYSDHEGEFGITPRNGADAASTHKRVQRSQSQPIAIPNTT